MRIAVNASSFKNNYSENDINSFSAIFLNIALSHPEDAFIFIFDTPDFPEFDFPKNVTTVVKGPEANSPIKWRIWYNIKIPAVLKKYKADIFVSEKFCSLITKVPQILISPDLTFIHQPSFVNKKHLHFYKKYTPLFLNTAVEVIVHSTFLKNELIKDFKINKNKIKVLTLEVDKVFKPLNHEEKELIKEKYAEGNEYFIYKGIISPQQNLMNLLKAFSFFKKRQKSKMQLIIAGKPGIQYEKFVESLRLYRFNKEVKVLENLSKDEIAKITAAAYSMVYVPLYETSSTIPLEAMKCEVPVIASSSGSLHEFCGDAALYTDPENFNDIAEKMMLIFKDEQMRKEFIEKGIKRIKQFLDEGNSFSLFKIIKPHALKNPF